MSDAPVVRARHTVAICDDQEHMRAALVDVLSSNPELTVVGDAHDASSCLLLLERTHPDVLVMDVRMPGGGVDLVRRVRELEPAPYVLAFSAHEDERVRADLLAAGADDYLVKTGRLRPLVEAVLSGGRRRHP